MAKRNDQVNNRYDWERRDIEVEAELDSEIMLWREQQELNQIPPGLDQKVSQMARFSVGDELESHWLFSQSTRLILVTLLLFAIGIAYVLSL